MNQLRFRFWVRRSAGDDPTYSIRFEVQQGKGLLRVARPGVLVDPPARQSGFEERLSPAQVRASRFLHVWDQGRKRQGYVLSRLSDPVLGELEAEAWSEMIVQSEGGFCWLVPGTPPDEEEEQATETGFMAVEAFPEDALVLDDDGAFTDDESALTQPAAPALSAPLPPARDSVAAFGRATTLVRHMRREKLRDADAMRALKHRVDELEAKLQAAEEREQQLRSRVTRYQRRLKAQDASRKR